MLFVSVKKTCARAAAFCMYNPQKMAVETTAVVILSASIGGNIPRRTGASPCLLRLQGGDSNGAESPLTSAAAHKRLCRYGFFPEPVWDRLAAPQPPGPYRGSDCLPRLPRGHTGHSGCTMCLTRLRL